MISPHIWSEEEKTYLKEIVFGRSWEEIQELMNNKFEYQFEVTQIASAIKRYKLSTGRTGRFEKGNISFNKGKKGLVGANRTSFKKGDIPTNKKPIGSERIDVSGYIKIKVAEPNVYKLKHRVVYEQYHNVKLKSTDIIIFLDKDKRNLDINNLQKITQKQLFQLNINDLIKDSPDLTKAGINIADLIIKINEIKTNKD